MWHYICLYAIQPLNQLTAAHDTSRERYAIGRYPKTVLPISCHNSKEHCGLANFCGVCVCVWGGGAMMSAASFTAPNLFVDGLWGAETM